MPYTCLIIRASSLLSIGGARQADDTPMRRVPWRYVYDDGSTVRLANVGVGKIRTLAGHACDPGAGARVGPQYAIHTDPGRVARMRDAVRSGWSFVAVEYEALKL